MIFRPREGSNDFMKLPARLRDARNLTEACETAEFVTAEAELAEVTTCAACVHAAIADARRRAVFWEFVEAGASVKTLFF